MTSKFLILLTVVVLLNQPGCKQAALPSKSPPPADVAPQPSDTLRAGDSIQETLDKNPGRIVDIGSGDWKISRRIKIEHDRSGLCGSGRIIQSNPSEPIVQIENAADVKIRDITLMRSDGAKDCEAEGIVVRKCRYLLLSGVTVLDNCSRLSAISLQDCVLASVTGCQVRNYMRIAIDDRTEKTEHYGYAFRCIDGTGIGVRSSQGTLISNNIVIEENLRPTPEMKEKYRLGTFSRKSAQKGDLVSQEAWDAEYVSNWQQGSAIWVSSSESTKFTRIIGNHVSNAAQGLDIHSDQVIVANNIVENAWMGMKAMHGSRNVLITGNQFFGNVIWSIGLMPGAAAHGTKAKDGSAVAPNADGCSIIANNIISDFGYGDSYWVWKDGSRSPFRFDIGQEEDDPPLSDVIISGNLVQESGKKMPAGEADQTLEAPRYQYTVIISSDATGKKNPRGLHFQNNILQPGSQGVSNMDLPP